VRYIKFEKIVEAVESLCIAAAHELPEDVLAALQNASEKETNPDAAKILNQLIENARIAKAESIPLCQDTGLAVVFAEQGANVAVKPPTGQTNATLVDAINAGVAAGYEKGYLRKSVVTDPLNKRTNTRSNTPAIIHHTIVPGDKLKLTVMTKGGGCENKSQFKMFKPTAERNRIIEWIVDVIRRAGADACPPFVPVPKSEHKKRRRILRKARNGFALRNQCARHWPAGARRRHYNPCLSNRDRPVSYSIAAGGGKHRMPQPPAQISCYLTGCSIMSARPTSIYCPPLV
jgi:hypothetical protein